MKKSGLDLYEESQTGGQCSRKRNINQCAIGMTSPQPILLEGAL